MEWKKIYKKSAATPEVLQNEASECGAASLCMILKYYGCDIPIADVNNVCGVSRDGCNAYDILMAGKHFGLDSHGYKVTLEKLAEAPKPCIIHWDFDHFVVLEKANGKIAVINDPVYGHRTVSYDELDLYYTGIVLVFSPGASFQKIKRSSEIIQFTKTRLGSERRTIIFLVLSGLLLAVPGLVIPKIQSVFIDNYAIAEPGYIQSLVTAMLFLLIAQFVVKALRSLVVARLKLKISTKSAMLLMQKMIRLPMTFYSQRFSGDLATRVEKDKEINSFFAENVIGVFLDCITAAACLVMILLINVRLTLFGLIGVVLSIIVAHFMTKSVERLNIKKVQADSNLSGILCAGISASESVKACGIENEYSSEILGHYAKLTESDQKAGVVSQYVSLIPSFITQVVSILVLAYGAVIIMKGDLSIGELIAFSSLLGTFTEPINSILGFSVSLQDMKAKFSRIDDILTSKSDVRFESISSKDSNIYKGKLSGNISMENVSFSYSPNRDPVIRNVSLKIYPGTTIVLSGPSGCGKSTLAKLMAGLLEPTGGIIKYDSRPIQLIDMHWLCNSLSVVSQEPELFCGTLRENITMRKGGTDDMLIRAAQDAEIFDFIMSLPEGFDYKIRERGSNFSGGQRQRLMIARALYTDPSIVIFDEATSALDYATEEKIYRNLKARGCTAIIIAHRLSAAHDCDGIAVMDKGEIVEFGTHEKLLSQNGLYSELISS